MRSCSATQRSGGSEQPAARSAGGADRREWGNCRAWQRPKPFRRVFPARSALGEELELVAFEAKVGEDQMTGEGADVAEEEHLTRLDTGLGRDPAGAGLEWRPVGLGVVTLEPLVAAVPAVLVFGGAEHDPGARGPEVCEVGVG